MNWLFLALYDMAQSCQLSGAPIQAEEYLKRALDLTETFGEVDRFRGYVLGKCCCSVHEIDILHILYLSVICDNNDPSLSLQW